MVKNDCVKGFRDYLGVDARKREKILELIKNKFEIFGYEPAETPIIEFESFVKGDNTNDEAVRDVFKLKDRGKRELALRFEFTFQLKRIAKKQKLPFRRYQIGYNFRDEPIREGRSRQFIQADADIIGSTIKNEAENFLLIKEVMNELKIPSTIYINNRKLLNEILVDLDIEERNREEVIRTIDKLDKLPKKEVADLLKKLGAEKLMKIVEEEEEYFEKYGSYNEIKELKEYCRLFGVEVVFRPFLARGFSYYNSTVFEVWSDKLKVSIMGGGSYLIDSVQATGISFGIEPIFLLSEIEGENVDYMVLSLGQDKKAIGMVSSLREKGQKVIFMGDKTVKKAFDFANSKKIKRVIVVGEEEANSGKVKVKDMESGKEEEVMIKDLN